MNPIDIIKQKAKILIIDDSDFSRKHIIELLVSEQITIVGEAANTHQASEILNFRPVNLVLLDIVMPEISGIEFSSYLKEHFKQIQIIMFSSLNNETIILEAIASGACDFLPKPVQKEDLINSIFKACLNLDDDMF